jgi:FKBP-type peptidyl-prolyl cis-trans isomerase FklB
MEDEESGGRIKKSSPLKDELQNSGIAAISDKQERATAVLQLLSKRVRWNGEYALWAKPASKVLKEGTGKIPADTSTVTMHYEGRLINDSVFDSSYKRNQPYTVRCNQNIKGFTEALTHMPAGSIWEVYIPQELAYGERQAGAMIKPFSALIFKIELMEVK